MTSLRFVTEIFRKFAALFSANVALLVVVGVLDAAAILSLAPVVDLFVHPDLTNASKITMYIAAAFGIAGIPMTLETVAATFVILNLLRTVVYVGARYLIFKTKYRFLRGVIDETLAAFYRARWQFFTSTSQGTLINTFLYELHRVGDAFGAVALCAASMFQALLFLVVPACVSWQVTGVSVLAGVVMAAPLFLVGRLGHRLGRATTSTANSFSSLIQESLGLAKLIIGFSNEPKQLEQVTRAFDGHGSAVVKSLTLQVGVPLAYFPMGLLVIVIALLASKHLMVPLSDATVVLYALLRMLPLIGQIPAQKAAMDTLFASFEQIYELRERAISLRQQTGDKPFTGLEREISIEELCFSHPGHDPILNGVTLRIPKGSMVALVGESGSGKSTLIDIIMGFHEIESGKVLIDGAPLREFDIASYRRRVGYVPQESVVFNLSIRDNFLWVRDDITEDEMRHACELANAAEFIERLPKAYDTVVGDRGVRLSGGQVQRLALARALLVKPDILVLDEATSSLDSQSERFIQQSIESVSRQVTVIVVAHRLSTIANADHIYVLRDGRVVEHGTYERLSSLGGEFSRMIAVQALSHVAREL